jgi:hypothetical protein
MDVKLRSISGVGIRAIFYKGGQRIGNNVFGNEAVVRIPTDEELMHRPEETPKIAGYEDAEGMTHAFGFTGYYMVPSLDLGLAAIFGATIAR